MIPVVAEFVPAAASDEEFVELNALSNRISAERVADDPPVPVAVTKAQLLNLPPDMEARLFTARDSTGGLIGLAQAGIARSGDNDHLAHFDVSVLPEHRRQGVARQLLARVVDFAEGTERRLLVAGTSASIPAGAAFLERIGGQPGMENTVNQLVLADVDRALVAEWIAAGEALPDYDLEWIDGSIPDDRLDEMAGVFELMNDQPFDEIEFNDEHLTPERVKASDEALFAQGVERWIAVARHRPSGALAGFTEVFYRPEIPQRLGQGGTAVDPKHRGHKLGKWLKAAMVERVLRERPNVDVIRTGNANSNAAMLAINHQLGFRAFRAGTMWQLETAAARAYLDGRGNRFDG